LSDEERQVLDRVSALPPEYPGWMIERLGASQIELARLASKNA
jgi:hypothetical protein